jgi:hypothetical protein
VPWETRFWEVQFLLHEVLHIPDAGEHRGAGVQREGSDVGFRIRKAVKVRDLLDAAGNQTLKQSKDAVFTK